MGRGFDLIVAASEQIRQGSLYIGLLVLLMLGPAVALGATLLASGPADVDAVLADLEGLGRALEAGDVVEDDGLARYLSVVLLLAFLAIGAFVGIIAVAFEAQIMGVAILAGRLAGRPLRLREALVRSRQTFWRVVRAAFLVAIPVTLAQGLLAQALGETDVPAEGSTLLGTLVGALVGAPFGYVTSAIVLGDVRAREALSRSIRLARARWRLAMVVALFPAVFSSVQIFALGAGGDLVVRFADAADLGFESGPVRSVATAGLILAVIAAIGSLVFTMSAVLAAPQVVAFVGLTHYVAGLDGARLPAVAPALPAPAAAPLAGGPATAAGPTPSAEETGAPASTWTTPLPAQRFHWLSRPMLAGIAAMAILAAIGMAMAAGLGGA